MIDNPVQFQPLRRSIKPFIVLMNIKDLDSYKAPVMNKSLFMRSKFVKYDQILEHFDKNLVIYEPTKVFRDVPFHYFYENVRDEYFTYQSLPLTNRSFLMHQLIQKKVIDIKFQDAIVVVLADEFVSYTAPRTFYDTLNYRLLQTLGAIYDLPVNNIVLFNDIVNWDVYNADRSSPTPQIHNRFSEDSMVFFNMDILKQQYLLYNNKR